MRDGGVKPGVRRNGRDSSSLMRKVRKQTIMLDDSSSQELITSRPSRLSTHYEGCCLKRGWNYGKTDNSFPESTIKGAAR